MKRNLLQPIRTLACVTALLVLPAARMPGQQPNTATLVQVVQPANASVLWPAPASIGFGTALDSTQLNASASVPGTFLYTPAAGTILAPGQTLLSVTFTPDNPSVHSTSLQVPLAVRPPNGATFHFELDEALGKISHRAVAAGDILDLKLTAAGDFHQPITFSCVAPAGISCSFTPATVRPALGPARVRVTFTGLHAANEPASRWPLPGLAGLAVLLLRRRRLKSLMHAGALLLLLALATLTGGGCGTERPTRDSLEITASSLLESKSLTVGLREW